MIPAMKEGRYSNQSIRLGLEKYMSWLHFRSTLCPRGVNESRTLRAVRNIENDDSLKLPPLNYPLIEIRSWTRKQR
jgi:hypothetical protein